jgi:hypothetical protein
MSPGSYLVLVQDLAQFQTLFPNVTNVIGDFVFGLSGAGELIRLFDNNEVLIDFVEYDDNYPWPVEPDGNGPTLELIDPGLDNNVGSNWDACSPAGSEYGTPGALNHDCSLGIEEEEQVMATIIPNPMKTNTTIRIMNYYDPVNLVVHDLIGREILNLESEKSTIQLERNNLPTGLYILRIESLDGTVLFTEKLLIE